MDALLGVGGVGSCCFGGIASAGLEGVDGFCNRGGRAKRGGCAKAGGCGGIDGIDGIDDIGGISGSGEGAAADCMVELGGVILGMLVGGNSFASMGGTMEGNPF